MDRPLRLGVYGGTFSPPHIGHIESAKDFIEQAELDRLLVIPDYLPPHKEIYESVTPDERLAMCRIAFSGLPKTEISDMEICRGGKSYTVDTLASLSADGTELFLLIGTDMFLSLETWHCPEKLFDLCTICFVRREDDPEITEQIRKAEETYREKYGAKIFQIPHTARIVSSSEIRDELKTQIAPNADIQPEVMRYIREKGLYSR